jgi:hypothetical protein
MGPKLGGATASGISEGYTGNQGDQGKTRYRGAFADQAGLKAGATNGARRMGQGDGRLFLKRVFQE